MRRLMTPSSQGMNSKSSTVIPATYGFAASSGTPQINWDGKVLGCCVNHRGDFGGNAFRDGLTASVNTEQIQYARAMLLGHAPPRAAPPPQRLRNWAVRHVPAFAKPTLKKIYWGVYHLASNWLPQRA